jgi:shikimate dehydrogenase
MTREGVLCARHGETAMPDLYGVIGNPIGHTKSPAIHAAFAEATAQDLVYVAIEGPLGEFAARVDQFRRDGGRGLNVTIPFKLDAFAYATNCSERATLAGAVNAMKFEGARVYAENFDGIGLRTDVERNLKCPLAGRRVLLLGAGGAVRGVLKPFLDEAPETLVIANRTPDKARALAAAFAEHGPVAAVEYADLSALPAFDIVVNATSASLFGQLPPVPSKSFGAGGLAYELAYGKGLTPFLKAGRSAGAGRLADGVGMLVEQAAEAFQWWRGVRPDTASIIERLTIPLE